MQQAAEGLNVTKAAAHIVAIAAPAAIDRPLARLRRDGVRHRYLLDLEPVHSPERIARPPAVSRFVIAVVAAEAR